MEKTQGGIWKTSTCAYLCMKKREWEQGHFSSSPQPSLPAPSPPLAVGAHVCDALLKGKADSLVDTLNPTQYCPRIKQTLIWIKKDISQTFKSRANKREWPHCLLVLIYPFQLWAYNTMSNFNLVSALNLVTAYLDFHIIALGILKAFSA